VLTQRRKDVFQSLTPPGVTPTPLRTGHNPLALMAGDEVPLCGVD